MFIIKARDLFGQWQHFNASDEFFSDTLGEIFELGFTDIEVYARIGFGKKAEVTYFPTDIWH